MKKSLYLLVALAMIATMLLAACAAPAAQPAPQPAAPTEAPKAAAEPTAAPAPAGETTIAFSGFAMTNDFWNTLEKAAEAEAGAQKVKFINLTTDVQDAEAQKRAVDNAITQKVSGIIIGATDSRGWDDTLAKAKAAGIPVVAVDTAIENDYIASLIQTDNLAAAGLAGDYLCQVLGGKGKALVLGGSVGHQTGDARKNGVEEKLKACGVTVIGDYSDWNENKSAELAQNTLTANPDLGAIFVAFDPGAAAAAAVVTQKGLAGKVPVVGFDALPVALKAIAAGEMAATVRQDPAKMGKEGVALILKLLKGEKVEPKTMIPGELITKDNVDKFLAPDASAPAAPAGDVTIAFSGFAMTNDFWNTLEKAAEAEAGAQKVKFINLTTDVQDAEAQKRAVDNAITQKVSGIIIGATDSRGWDDTLAKAKAAGIPVVAVDTAIENDYIASLIQTDNLAAAGLAGDYLCQVLGGKGKALVLGGSVGHQTGDARKNGVEEKLKACGVTVIGDYSDWNENKSAELAQNTLTANPDLGAIFVAFDPGAAAAAAVVTQKGLAGKVPVVGFDALPVALKAIAAGEMAATVRQDPAKMGKEGVALILKLLKGEKVEPKTMIPGLLITKDNVDEFLPK